MTITVYGMVKVAGVTYQDQEILTLLSKDIEGWQWAGDDLETESNIYATDGRNEASFYGTDGGLPAALEYISKLLSNG